MPCGGRGDGAGPSEEARDGAWWVLDACPDRRSNRMELWLTGPGGARRLGFRYLPEFYVWASGSDIERARRHFSHGDLYECGMVERRLGIGPGRPHRVLKVVPRNLGLHLRAARAADFFGGFGRFRFYNLDIDLGQRFLLEQGLFPLARIKGPFLDPWKHPEGAVPAVALPAEAAGCGRAGGPGSGGECRERNGSPGAPSPRWNLVDNRLSVHYPSPRLRRSELKVAVRKRGLLPSFEDPLDYMEACGQRLSGGEEEVLVELQRVLEREDPDVLVTDDGDSFALPYLYHRARLAGLAGFCLGRLGQAAGPNRKEKSYFTYGRIMYRPAAYYLRGRLHVDSASSFLYQAGGLDGILELSRLSGITFQRMARASPGTAISAMEVNAVLLEGGLVAWKKNRPEDFKSLRCLLSTDRGGLIYEPEVGLHERVLEVDFASMYPHIMVIHNISPETLNCDCCGPEGAGGREPGAGDGTPDPHEPPSSSVPAPGPRPPAPGSPVPVIGYWTCTRRVGLIPRVLEPLVKRRAELKRLRRRSGDRWDRRVSCLKPLLVTCFGYTGYRNAPFGRIECHEAINSYGREILMGSARIAERRGFQVVHGIVDSLWLRGPLEKKEALVEELSRAAGIPLGIEGVYRWLVFLPGKLTGAGALNRYFGLFDNGEFKLRGIALRKHDTPELVRELQMGMLEALSKADGAQAFWGRIPDALEVLRAFSRRVLAGECAPEELVLTKHVSRNLEDYVQFNDTRCALERLRGAGLTVPAGDSVRYVVADGAARDPAKRTVPVQFFETAGRDWKYDRGAYHKLLLRAAEELLAPFGYGMERLDRVVRGNDHVQAVLPEGRRQ